MDEHGQRVGRETRPSSPGKTVDFVFRRRVSRLTVAVWRLKDLI